MTKYNGWTNKPTWLINMWLGDWLIEYVEEQKPTNIEEFIKNEVDSYFEEKIDSASLETDLLNYALYEVNYRELAEHYKET